MRTFTYGEKEIAHLKKKDKKFDIKILRLECFFINFKITMGIFG